VDALVTSLGWIGAVICIVAYLLVSRGTWSPSSTRYQLANVVGALLLCTVAARGRVWPSLVTNLVWAVIGAQAVVTLLRARRARTVAVRVAAVPARTLPAQAVRGDLSRV
jgi:uncharacterized membrane protein YeaQ/YmgE (transglycosylase-associated protein family)